MSSVFVRVPSPQKRLDLSVMFMRCLFSSPSWIGIAFQRSKQAQESPEDIALSDSRVLQEQDEEESTTP